MRNGARNSLLDCSLAANVNSDGKRAAARRFYFLCSRVNCAGNPVEHVSLYAFSEAQERTSLGSSVSDFAAITTLAPSLAARRAIASPMPRDAPVMNKVRPHKERCGRAGWGASVLYTAAHPAVAAGAMWLESL